jgi:ABC-2 type transport system ATP-binding protein
MMSIPGSDPGLPLVVERLSKAYRRRAVLRDVSLVARPGEAVGVIGPNGAGKSTLLGCLSGERVPDSGAIRVCGADALSDPRAAARCMGFVPEQPVLYGELTVGEVLDFVLAARGLPAARGGAEAERLLDLLGLAEAREVLCRELSQGMGRKLALITALLHEPRLIVLDEALNGLDRTSAERLIGELDARRSRGAAVVIASHDLDFLAAWCGAALLLAPGARSAWLEGEAWRAWQAAPALDAAALDS